MSGSPVQGSLLLYRPPLMAVVLFTARSFGALADLVFDVERFTVFFAGIFASVLSSVLSLSPFAWSGSRCAQSYTAAPGFPAWSGSVVQGREHRPAGGGLWSSPVSHLGASIQEAVPEGEADGPGASGAVDPERPRAAAVGRRIASDDEVDVPAADRRVAVAGKDSAGLVQPQKRKRIWGSIARHLMDDRNELPAEEREKRLVVEDGGSRPLAFVAQQMLISLEPTVVLADGADEGRSEGSAQHRAT